MNAKNTNKEPWRRTTFLITETLACLEDAILLEQGIPRKLLHKRAFEDFLAGDQAVMPRLKVVKRDDPLYVKKTVRESVYLELLQSEALQKAAERNGCGITAVMFQALHDYCIKQAAALPGDAVDAILRGEPWRRDRS